MRKLALYWEKHKSEVKCVLCPNYCIIPDTKHGKCRKRVNISGELFTENYAETISLSLDPMEKKPLYHFCPTEQILSLGANSCNLTCKFCQNHSSSQTDCATQSILPNELLDLCLQKSIRHVAFTYTEPFTWYEYILECAELLSGSDISVALVTNGYVNIEPLNAILPYISAMNIDLKAYSESFYKEVCGGQLQPVLDVIKHCHDKVHLEITLLLIETLNDDSDKLRRLFSFIKNLDSDIPLHISKYFPRYEMSIKETSERKLLGVAQMAKEYLNYVYIGNVGFSEFQSTYCSKCGALLVERQRFNVKIVSLENGRCKKCDNQILHGRASKQSSQ